MLQVRPLLRAYPPAASIPAFRSELPLHLGLVAGADDGAILALLASYPEAAAFANDDGALPLHLAAQVWEEAHVRPVDFLSLRPVCTASY